jgi:hypothetical protein
MLEIVRLFYDICLFKKSPQDVPFSPFLTRLTLIAYAVISFLTLFMSSHWFNALLEMVADIVMLMLFVRIVLAWVHKSERYHQTFCALLGSDCLITLAAIPATAVMLVPSGDLVVMGFFIVVGLMLWHLAIIAHILSHALSESFGFSLGLSLLYMMSIYWFMGLLFSPATVSGG